MNPICSVSPNYCIASYSSNSDVSPSSDPITSIGFAVMIAITVGATILSTVNKNRNA